jgi:hypothetical protein
MHSLPIDVEDPPPADGNPHPFHGPHMTAEQRFQQRLQVWLQQNGIFRGANGATHGDANSRNNTTLGRQNPVRLLNNSDPVRGQVNYQAVLREQGVLFSHGIGTFQLCF